MDRNKLKHTAINEFPPPMRYNLTDMPDGMTACSNSVGLKCAKVAISLLQYNDNGFPINLIPNLSLVSSPLLGPYTNHYRNYLYNPNICLQNLIEEKINKSTAYGYLISINSSVNYMVFKINHFAYKLLEYLKNETYAIDFIYVSMDFSYLYIFHEDEPACFICYPNKLAFELDFISPFAALHIFFSNIEEWKITKLRKEEKWIEYLKELYQQ